MKKVKSNAGEDAGLFLSRELSWLDFNSRVLDEAGTPANPLLERLKFIAIFSSNLDEFFMVRIAGLRQLVKMGQDLPDPAGNRPSEQLSAARRKIERLVRRQYDYLCDDILPALAERGVRLAEPAELPAAVRSELAGYFRAQVLPVLTPLAVDQAHPFPILNSGAIEIAVSMKPAEKDNVVYAFVEVPEVLPRFIEVPAGGTGRTFVLLEDLIMDNLGGLFTGCELEEFFPFRITRDMDFSVEDEGVEDLLQSIEKKLLQRRHREPIRLELPHNVRGPLARWLTREFRLDEEFRYTVRGPLHLKQFFELVGKARLPELLEPAWPPVMPEAFREGSVFEAIAARGTVLVAPPFHSFSPILKLLAEAADDPDVLAASFKPNTRLVFLETPTNPTMKVADVAAVGEAAHAHGAVFAVDNTFLTMYFQKPFELGADVVIYSGTKYLCGHNDVLSGFLILRDNTLLEPLFNATMSEGNQLDPFDSWLMLRSLKTLGVRLRQQERNAKHIAEALKANPHVTDVFYVGDPDHPNYELSKRQTTGFGAMISFKTDTHERALAVLERTKLILFAESLGGTESLVTYPLVQTHGSIPKSLLDKLGIDDRLLRLSVGIEDIDDLLADLEQALA